MVHTEDLSRANLERMRRMGIKDHELNIVVGALAGCEHMAHALGLVERRRRENAERAAAQTGPIEGQTVIELPAYPKLRAV